MGRSVRMPRWQRAVLTACLVALAFTVVPLAVPNRCGGFDVNAAFRHKDDIHVVSGVPTAGEREAERACVDDSRKELARAVVTALVAGPVLVALVAVPAVVRRARHAAGRA